MTIRSLSAVVALGLGLCMAAEAQAWFAGSSDVRPPPNGLNGLAENGIAVRGLASHGVGSTMIEAVVLADGSRARLR